MNKSLVVSVAEKCTLVYDCYRDTILLENPYTNTVLVWGQLPCNQWRLEEVTGVHFVFTC